MQAIDECLGVNLKYPLSSASLTPNSYLLGYPFSHLLRRRPYKSESEDREPGTTSLPTDMASTPHNQGNAQSSSDTQGHRYEVAPLDDDNDGTLSTSYLQQNPYHIGNAQGTARIPVGYVPEYGCPEETPNYPAGTMWPGPQNVNDPQFQGYTGSGLHDQSRYNDRTGHGGRQYGLEDPVTYASIQATSATTHYNLQSSRGAVPSSSPVAQDAQLQEFVQCDHCKTILNGQHSRGNLTRHQKSKKCRTSSQSRIFPCNEPGCDKFYHRSDALLNHRRKIHGAPGPLRRNPSMENQEVVFS
ncbi:hypothetical protein K491DRAFT_10679 [Lophiostoma macrostomum CBS 122681]|uniref:C2H2-type domain-containing protein n=1 Tax=Lophiostoma macrostomum CBS 122681 TaxID=1314788 RepID=A0A6A6TUJ1_9PLEO|nr:hypothetical protein K491DRAFT_10679 [Lophiostoma macrostomum CBS 122681]